MLDLDSARSYMLCPGDDAPKLAKAAARGADVTVVDFEDGVASTEKQRARDVASSIIRSVSGTYVVRINDPTADGGKLAEADLQAIFDLPIAGVVIPKVESADSIDMVSDCLASLGRVVDGEFEVIPMIESPAGVEDLDLIIRNCAIELRRVGFGAADYLLRMGAPWLNISSQLLYARSRIANVSRARGLSSPIDTGSLLLHDRATFVSDVEEARLLGYCAKFCIHPRQAEWFHEAQRPSDEELRRAEAIVHAFEADGAAAVLAVDGIMVDLPVVESARSLLRRSAR
jgi:citrate lyase subunit beta/citryl-CoA lyase